MIEAVAAVVVAGAAEAACSYIPPTKTLTQSAWAYQWKFSGKTTKAIKVECNGEKVTRTSASLKIQGWSFYCEPECNDFESAEADEIFWSTKPEKLGLLGGVTFELGNIIGKKGKNYEAYGTASFKAIDDQGADYADYELTFAGIGKYDTKNARVSSIKGNFAGNAMAPSLTWYNKANCGYDGAVSKVWECCGCPTLDAWTVAYGKWSVKFNKGNAKKYGDSKLEISKLLPGWAK